jgi:hypothetical protein
VSWSSTGFFRYFEYTNTGILCYCSILTVVTTTVRDTVVLSYFGFQSASTRLKYLSAITDLSETFQRPTLLVRGLFQPSPQFFTSLHRHIYRWSHTRRQNEGDFDVSSWLAKTISWLVIPEGRIVEHGHPHPCQTRNAKPRWCNLHPLRVLSHGWRWGFRSDDYMCIVFVYITVRIANFVSDLLLRCLSVLPHTMIRLFRSMVARRSKKRLNSRILIKHGRSWVAALSSQKRWVSLVKWAKHEAYSLFLLIRNRLVCFHSKN